MKYLFLLLLVPLTSWCDSPDLTHRLGVSLSAGFDIPVSGNNFDEDANGEFVAGIAGRYQLTPKSSLQLGYTRFEWSNSPAAVRLYDVMYIYRVTSLDWITPILGAGAGAVDIANYNIDENLKLGLRARLGAEWILSKEVVMDFVVDYLYVCQMPGEEGTLESNEIQAFAPQVVATYYFM
jgi:hypothetical protein